jgi:hypothetical protein
MIRVDRSVFGALQILLVHRGDRLSCRGALGLTWKSVNLRGRTVQIGQSLQRAKGGGYISPDRAGGLNGVPRPFSQNNFRLFR